MKKTLSLMISIIFIISLLIRYGGIQCHVSCTTCFQHFVRGETKNKNGFFWGKQRILAYTLLPALSEHENQRKTPVD